MKKMYFSQYQLMCLAGKAQDECEKRNIKWSKHSKKIAGIAIHNNSEGKADMGKCMKEIFDYIDKIKVMKNENKK